MLRRIKRLFAWLSAHAGFNEDYEKYTKPENRLLSYNGCPFRAWRGNCPCGKWLVVLESYTKADPRRCSCGRCWYNNNFNAEFDWVV